MLYIIQSKTWIKKYILFSYELVWHSGSIMDCHVTARDSIPDGTGVKTELHILREGQ